MNYLPRMLQKLKKMRYFRNFCSLLSKNLRLAQNLPNEVFVYKSDFKVDIPHTETLRISLAKSVFPNLVIYHELRDFGVSLRDRNFPSVRSHESPKSP